MSKKLQETHPWNGFHKDYIAMTIPLFLMAFFLYGPRVLGLGLVGIITASLTDRLAAMLRGRKYNPTENSSIAIALTIVLLMPATVRFRVVIMAVIAAVLVAKEAFGGFGSYPFNPAAVGFCVAAISWPEEMFRYPEARVWYDASTWTGDGLRQMWTMENASIASSPSYILKHGGVPTIDNWNLALGNFLGPLGATSFIIIVTCAVFLVMRKRMPLSAPLAFLGTAALIAFLFPRAPQDVWQIMPWVDGNVWVRLDSVKYEVLAGTLPFAAVFLVPEATTLPKNFASRIIYGVLLGFATMMFRYFGTYELGTCFAFLLVNAISGYFDRALARRASRRKGRKEVAQA